MVTELYEEMFSRRLAQLRMQKGVSARDMSLSLGQNHGYINSIENGKTFPTMTNFFYICEYLHITPQEFFDEQTQNPELIQKAIGGMRKLGEKDLLMLLGLINRLLDGNDQKPKSY